jgi:hypothetical protein
MIVIITFYFYVVLFCLIIDLVFRLLTKRWINFFGLFTILQILTGLAILFFGGISSIQVPMGVVKKSSSVWDWLILALGSLLLCNGVVGILKKNLSKYTAIVGIVLIIILLLIFKLMIYFYV